MPTTTKVLRDANVASNRLHNNEVHDFTEAVATYVAALANELAWNGGYGMAGGADWIAAEELRAQRALALYADEQAHATRRTATALRAAGLDEWATALETGDYSPLSI